MAKIYYDQDADLSLLKDKTIAIIGYGIQGRGQALCLRDSGCRVIISELEGTPNFEQVKKDGFIPVAAAEAAKSSDIIQILTQDHVQARFTKKVLSPI
jgi:ketol-acid reductoisomerase